MSLTATRCVFRTVISGKHMNSVSLNITFMTLQFHKVQSKCLLTNFATVSRNTQIYHTSKRHINVTAASMMSKTHYDVLGVPKSANQKEIKDAYYKLAMKYHPDKNQGNLTQQFREIKEAYDVLGNESSRTIYDKNLSNTNYSSTSSNWTSNSSDGRYQNPYEQYTYTYTNKRTNYRTQYKRAEKHTYNYDHLKPFNVFINIIKVPKNVIKTHVDIMLLTFIKNRTLKLILFQLFQLVWNQMLKNLNFNVLISTAAPDSSLGVFIKSLLGTNTVRIELTDIDSYKGKSVRINVNDDEKVLVVNIPKGVKRNESFFLFYLVDDNDNDAKLKN